MNSKAETTEIQENNFDYSENYFEGLSNSWNRISFPIISKLLQPVLAKFNPENVLDLGCGNGIYFDVLKSPTNNVFGLDVSEQSVLLCSKKGYREVKLADATTLPYSDQSFDFVFTSEVLEHVENHNFMLQEIHRVLKPGGVLFLTTTCYSTSIFQFLLRAKGASYLQEVKTYMQGFFSTEKRNLFVRKWAFESLGGHFHGFLPKLLKQNVRETGMKILDDKILFISPAIPIDPTQMKNAARSKERKKSTVKKMAMLSASFAIASLNPLFKTLHLFGNNVYILGEKN